mmetsp:Transcript_31779/g.82922  ORF Transcript_31779/g.82922 Transcript_31779/m.82922 type:complete len:157 (-) Transcript_31779:720-1190(-)
MFDSIRAPFAGRSDLEAKAILTTVLNKDRPNDPFRSLNLPEIGASSDQHQVVAPGLLVTEIAAAKENDLSPLQFASVKRRYVEESIRMGCLTEKQAFEIAKHLANEAKDVRRFASKLNLSAMESKSTKGIENVDKLMNVFDYLKKNGFLESQEAFS